MSASVAMEHMIPDLLISEKVNASMMFIYLFISAVCQINILWLSFD